jgi:hypothetical protein
MDDGLYVFQFTLTVPVELTSFTASASDNSVILDWETATEKNNLGFEIQKKLSGNFTTIGFIEGAGTTIEPQQYSFTDKNLGSGIYSYRLKQIDFNGSIQYSDEVEVTLLPVELALNQNYPNPFNPSTKIKFNVAEAGLVNLAIYNLLGEQISQLVNNNLVAGEYEIDFNAVGLPSGIYIAKLSSGEFVQTIKMSLLK